MSEQLALTYIFRNFAVQFQPFQEIIYDFYVDHRRSKTKT